MRSFNSSPSQPATAEREAPGTTLTASLIGFDTESERRAVMLAIARIP